MEADTELAKIVNECPLINADGASIVWAAKKLGVPLAERVTGIDLFQRLVALSAEKGYKLYLFGAKEEVVSKVKNIFEERYPGVQIVGFRNGYFTEADEPQIVADQRIPRLCGGCPALLQIGKGRVLPVRRERTREGPAFEMQRQIQNMPCRRLQKQTKNAQHTHHLAEVYAGHGNSILSFGWRTPGWRGRPHGR